MRQAVILNGDPTPNFTGTWTPTHDAILYEITGLPQGSHTFEIVVDDGYGKTTNSTVNVTVQPNQAPTLSSPEDLTIEEIVNRYVQSYNNIGNLKVDDNEKVITDWLNDSWLDSPNQDIGPHIQNTFRSTSPNSKFVYVELPYKFYNEHMVDWLWGKTEHFINDGSTLPLSEVKECIAKRDAQR